MNGPGHGKREAPGPGVLGPGLRRSGGGAILHATVRHRFALALILALTFVQRSFLYTLAFDLPFDSGSVGLMALHVMEGGRPLFLYGFHYSGALLPYLVALVFGGFGVSLWTFVLPSALLVVGWALVSYLLFRELFHPAAGLAAALCVAVPDWITSWYTIVPDCSYSPLFFLGSLALWLAVRLARRDLSSVSEWVHILALGLSAGLAMWTHPLAVAYLLPAALVLLPMLVRRRCAPGLLLKFLAGGVLMAAALLPYVLASVPAVGSDTPGWQLEGAVIRLNAKMLASKLLPGMFLWPDLGGDLAHRLALLLLALGGALYVLRLLASSDRRDAAAAALPLLFCACFLGFYLPSGKAAELAPRYVISFWTMAMFAMTAAPISARFRFLRLGGGLVLGLWAAYNTVGVISYAVTKQPKAASVRAAYTRLVDHAEAAGVDHVLMVGEYFFQAKGQGATFTARDRIRFVGADLERYAPSVHTADASETIGYAVEAERADSVREGLRMAGARFEETPDDWVHVFHHLEPPIPARGTVPPSELSVTVLKPLYGHGRALTDRTRKTDVMGKGIGSGFEIDLGAEHRVDGLALSPAIPEGRLLPTSFVIEGSRDGIGYHELLRVRDAEPMCYTAGDMVYLRGGYGWQQCRFASVQVRHIRFTVTGEAEEAPIWRANEVFVFTRAEGQAPGKADTDVEAVVGRIREQGVEFTVCDRWLSARLVEALPAREGMPPAYPRLNDHYHLVGAGPPEPRRTFSPSPRGAAVVAAALADEQEAILRGACADSGLAVQREDLGQYSLFLFEGPAGATAPALTWNGMLLLR